MSIETVTPPATIEASTEVVWYTLPWVEGWDCVEIGQAEATSRLGVRLAGKWCLVRLLGVGGMAAVYEARHATGRRVAVKMMHAHLKGNARLHQRFVREAYVANSLTHPAVVPVYDVDLHEDGTPYLIMDLLQGESIEVFRRKQGGQLCPERVMEIAEIVLEVLVEAHSKGIVHRDLKPANLFITERGEFKIFDFGIAKCAEFGPAFNAATRDGSLLGTPAFMSPEQARGHWSAVDHQSDLWSLGATLFLLLTGRAVHQAASLNEQWALAMGAPATKLRELRPDLPERLTTAVDGALCFAKSDRWHNAAHMYQALTGREAASLPKAEVPQEPAHDDFSTVTRAVTLKGSAAAGSKPRGQPRQIFLLTAVVVSLVAAVGASQRDASSSASRGQAIPAAQSTSQRAGSAAAPRALQPAASTASTGVPKQTRLRRLASEPATPAVAGSVAGNDAPRAVPGPQLAVRQPGARHELVSAPVAGRLQPALRREQVEPNRPTSNEGVEFGALLDVWE